MYAETQVDYIGAQLTKCYNIMYSRDHLCFNSLLFLRCACEHPVISVFLFGNFCTQNYASII